MSRLPSPCPESSGPAPRVASLLPAGTEIVAALGAAHLLVGISHQCDYPPALMSLPRLTTTPIDPAAASAVIDRQVRDLQSAGRAVIAVDGAALSAARPDLILVQDLCEVCAVVDGEVRTLAEQLTPAPALMPLVGRTLAGIFEDIRRVGSALGRREAADSLIQELEARLARLPPPPPDPPRVVVIEWMDPLYLAGHWIPDLVRLAGGRDVGAEPGSHSRRTSWGEVAALNPDLVLVALCGFGLARGVAEWHRSLLESAEAVQWLRPTPVWALDGDAYTARPGPRVVEGAELMARAIRSDPVAGLIRLR